MFDKLKNFLGKTSETTSCKRCGKIHSDLSDIVAISPIYWIDSFENAPDSHLDDDLCIIHEKDHFIKGVIQIPIINTNRHFGWGVWISLKQENFFAYRENFKSGDIGPFFGWLSNEISFYKETTINLKTRACFRGNGLRPIIEMAPCDHEIYKNQSEGITLETAWDIVHFYSD